MKKNKSIFKTGISKLNQVALAIVAYLLSASPALAQTVEWTGVCVAGPDGDVATLQGIECLVANIFAVIISLIAMAAFLMLIIGSVQWMISGGSPDGTKKARDTMTYAVLGIVIALSSFIVLNLVAGYTGVDAIKEFIVPTSDSS